MFEPNAFANTPEPPGFLGIESAHEANGFGITLSYWASLQAIQAWKANLEHRHAQQKGRGSWYEHYQIRVARIERAYGSRNSI